MAVGVAGEKTGPLSSGGVAPMDPVYDEEEKLSPLGMAVGAGLGPIGPPTHRYVEV